MIQFLSEVTLLANYASALCADDRPGVLWRRHSDWEATGTPNPAKKWVIFRLYSYPSCSIPYTWYTVHLNFGDEFQVQLDQGQAEPTRHGHLLPSNSWINYPELDVSVVLNKSFIEYLEYHSSNAIAKCVFQCAKENQTEPANCRYEEAQKEYENLGPSTEGTNLSQMRHFGQSVECHIMKQTYNNFCTSSGIITYAAYGGFLKWGYPKITNFNRIFSI